MDLDKSIPLAEAFAEAEQGTGSKQPNAACLNCGTLLTGKYCSNCGQKDLAKRQTIAELLENFIASFWSYESKFWTTLKYLLFKPGKLAQDYNQGKRERYYHPARLYVFISFVYFLLLVSLPDKDEEKDVATYSYTSDDSVDMKLDTAGSGLNIKISPDKKDKNWSFFGSDEITQYKTVESYDSAQQLLPEEQRDGWFRHLLVKRQIEINRKYREDDKEFNAKFSESYMGNISKIFFWLLPVFALILKLLYVRRDFFYSEHLVFSIYYYDFFFLAGSLYMLVDLIPIVGSLSWLIIIYIFIYLLLGMKNLYHQSWRKTIFKYCTFLFLFSFCILIGLAINLAMTLMFI
jgi:hypothetical protein